MDQNMDGNSFNHSNFEHSFQMHDTIPKFCRIPLIFYPLKKGNFITQNVLIERNCFGKTKIAQPALVRKVVVGKDSIHDNS